MTKGQDVTAKAATDFRQPACLPARRGLRRTWLRNLVAGGSALLVASCQLLGDGPTVGTVTPGTLRPNLAADIGEREHPRVVATYGGVYKDAGAERAVASVVGRLVAASEDPSQSYKITILNSPAINAFALPGGYLYVTRGLLALANDTSEVAAVLAHEMAHVTANHAIKRQQRAEAKQLANKILTDVVQDSEEARKAIISSQLSFARFSQVQELEADDIGVKTLARAGFDPYAAARFLRSMAAFARYQSADKSGSTAPDFLSSHPSTPERLQIAIRAARQIGAPGIGERDRTRYLSQIDGMLFGDDPLEGFVRGRSFLHKALGISYTVPSGYILENTPEAVLASNGDGTAIRFDGADVSSYSGLRDYMNSGWINGLLPESVRETTINGLPAVTGAAITQGWSFRIAVIRIGKTGYRFIFASRSPNETFDRDFHQTVESFQQLSPTERARLRSLRIKVVTSKPGDTPRKLAIGMSGVEPSRRLEFFSILNDLNADQAIPTGTAIKLIVD
ncbi:MULTISPECIES: M48 family metalloprotease [Stappiaceae]|jgi:predicted Zn-dependent protease|uniref:M48 family metalloprotease n=1 Tax=Stappiaceae TaxID=2821832 RepID=UPI0012A8DC55|nr:MULTISPECIES: M48 family metalloprotease [Stappiaceae]MCR9283330.1 M48 family metalloprotease [Paracoccaceae bacterium]MEC9418317.1 M48 family metalloprotease [Pseudomonadota bacterium]MBO9461709.1 M48 family metalloprotease [Labrenzia sp. R5_0]MEE2865639.1 M48 family metalloprotease [Pseudomonadota bacterium]QFT66574.1 TPR repeat-containing protein YfgC precursor [Labrenzia sp. THAF35]